MEYPSITPLCPNITFCLTPSPYLHDVIYERFLYPRSCAKLYCIDPLKIVFSLGPEQLLPNVPPIHLLHQVHHHQQTQTTKKISSSNSNNNIRQTNKQNILKQKKLMKLIRVRNWARVHSCPSEVCLVNNNSSSHVCKAHHVPTETETGPFCLRVSFTLGLDTSPALEKRAGGQHNKTILHLVQIFVRQPVDKPKLCWEWLLDLVKD